MGPDEQPDYLQAPLQCPGLTYCFCPTGEELRPRGRKGVHTGARKALLTDSPRQSSLDLPDLGPGAPRGLRVLVCSEQGPRDTSPRLDPAFISPHQPL